VASGKYNLIFGRRPRAAAAFNQGKIPGRPSGQPDFFFFCLLSCSARREEARFKRGTKRPRVLRRKAAAKHVPWPGGPRAFNGRYTWAGTKPGSSTFAEDPRTAAVLVSADVTNRDKGLCVSPCGLCDGLPVSGFVGLLVL